MHEEAAAGQQIKYRAIDEYDVGKIDRNIMLALDLVTC